MLVEALRVRPQPGGLDGMTGRASGGGVDGSPKDRAFRILIVDDLPQICDYFRDLLRRVREPKIVLTTEISSARARDLVAAEPFDLVVSDYRMPQVDGVEVLTTARTRNPQGRRILMTGYNEIPTSVHRVREADVDAFIQKPLNSEDLLLLILDFLHGNAKAISAWRARAREMELIALREEEAP